MYGVFNTPLALFGSTKILVSGQFFCGLAASMTFINIIGTITDMFGSLDDFDLPLGAIVAAASFGPSIGKSIWDMVLEKHG